MYNFDIPVVIPGVVGTSANELFLGASHGSELAFVFGTSPQFATDMGQATISKLMERYWTRFAATGDPNGGTDLMWPPFTATSNERMQFTLTPSVVIELPRRRVHVLDRPVRGAVRRARPLALAQRPRCVVITSTITHAWPSTSTGTITIYDHDQRVRSRLRPAVHEHVYESRVRERARVRARLAEYDHDHVYEYEHAWPSTRTTTSDEQEGEAALATLVC